MKEHNLPPELKNSICNDQLVLFIGAGLSYNLTNSRGQQLKGWSNLVEQTLAHLKGKDYDVDCLIPLISKYEPIKILDLIESDKSIPKSEIYDFVKDFFDLNVEINNFDLHKKLFTLSRKIITTNYDPAFEIAVSELRRKKAYKGRNYELTTHKNKDSALLFKLHGCFEDIESMVLFPTDYSSLYQNTDKDAEHSILVLKNIIFNKSVLFIGTGMGDFQINNIFKEIKKIQGEYNQQHFIIAKGPLDSSLSFLTPIYIDDYSEINALTDELISIRENCRIKESDEIRHLKEQLTVALERLESLQSADISSKNKLLEREALKYFSHGAELQLLNKTDDAIKEYQTALELKPNLFVAFFNWGIILSNIAKTKEGEDADELYNQAFEKYQKAIHFRPSYHEAFLNWGTDLGDLARSKEGQNIEEAEKLYNLAFEKYQKAVKIKEDYYEAFFNWGNDLGNLARAKEGQDLDAAEKLYNLAFEKYEKAVKIKEDYCEAFFNWGNDLGNMARAKEGQNAEGAEKLYHLAFEKYEMAVTYNPDFHEAFLSWGNDLACMAKTKTGTEAEEIYNLAFDKYKSAVEIKPDLYEAYFNWGNELGNMARIKADEAEELYPLAFEKYKIAVGIKPDLHDAFSNWGYELANLAKIKEEKNSNEAEELYQQAFEKYEKAIEYGGSYYNLSCIYAMKGDKENALKYLSQCLLSHEIEVGFVLGDEDWKNYLEDKDFRILLEKHTK